VEGRARPCYSRVVSARSIILSIAALGVLGMGIYLYLQVRADPIESAPPSTVVVAPRGVPIDRISTPVAASLPAPTLAVPAVPAQPVVPSGQDGSAVAVGSANSAPPVVPAMAMRALTARPNGIVLHPMLGHVVSNANPDQMLDQADKAVAAGDLAGAQKIAVAVIGQVPGNVRALTLLATTACAQADQAAAQRAYAQLPSDARSAVKAGCNLSLQDPQ
jgi:hypothetical protein